MNLFFHTDRFSQQKKFIHMHREGNILNRISNWGIESTDEYVVTRRKILTNRHNIMISNSGPRITSRQQRYIFDPFYTTKASTPHLGLGLSIAYRIIEEHKGFIEVENGDFGVVFRINLPIAN